MNTLLSYEDAVTKFFPDYNMRLQGICIGNIFPEEDLVLSMNLPSLSENLESLNQFDLILVELRDCASGEKVYPHLVDFDGQIIALDSGWTIQVAEGKREYLEILQQILKKSNLIIKLTANPIQPYLDTWQIDTPLRDDLSMPIPQEWISKDWSEGNSKEDKIIIIGPHHRDATYSVVACTEVLKDLDYPIDIVGNPEGLTKVELKDVNYLERFPQEHFEESIYPYKVLIDPHNIRTPGGRLAINAAISEVVSICPQSPPQRYLFPDFSYNYQCLDLLKEQVEQAFSNYETIIEEARENLKLYTIQRIKSEVMEYL